MIGLTVAALLLAGLIVAYVVVGALGDAHRRSTTRRLQRAHAHIATILLAPDIEARRAAERLRRLPRREILDLLQALSLELAGDAEARVQRIVTTTGLSRHIRDLADHRDWRRRTQAARLAQLLPDPSVGFELLDDRHPNVRATAAESLDTASVASATDRLLAMLDDPNRAVRFAAQQALLRGDARIIEPLITYLDDLGRPGARWALEVAANLPDPRLLEVIRRHAQSTDPDQRVTAATAAAHMGPRAIGYLQALLDDGSAQVRTAAVIAMGRMRVLPMAARLGTMLGDPAWTVRREAGNALDRMGSVGALVLRHHLADSDPFARDMARLTLDAIASRTGTWTVLPPSLDDELDMWTPVGAVR